jgi:retron-type reverse transcriptase
MELENRVEPMFHPDSYGHRLKRSALDAVLRSFKRLKAWWKGVTQRDPGLFAHWEWTYKFHPTGW